MLRTGFTDSNRDIKILTQRRPDDKFEVMVMGTKVSVQPKKNGNDSKGTVFLWERQMVSQQEYQPPPQ